MKINHNKGSIAFSIRKGRMLYSIKASPTSYDSWFKLRNHRLDSDETRYSIIDNYLWGVSIPYGVVGICGIHDKRIVNIGFKSYEEICEYVKRLEDDGYEDEEVFHTDF